jgi:hypothetical protein
LYEELIWIPLAIKLPDGENAGKKIPTRVRHLDIAPTLLDLVGTEQPEAFLGTSLVPVMEGNSDSVCEYVFSEQNLNRDVLYSVVSGGHKYILRTRPRFVQELYDLEADPHETENLIQRDAPTASELARTTISMIAESGRVSHIRFSSRGESVWEGRVLSKGMIARVYPVGLEDDDTVTLEYSAETLTFTVSTSGEPKGFDFVTAPATVPLVLDIKHNGARLDAQRLYLGPDMLTASAMPFNTERLTDQSLLYIFGEQVVEYEAGHACLFWKSVAPGSVVSTKTSLDSDTFDKLKALGYIE